MEINDKRYARIDQALSSLPETARQVTDLPDAFWIRQRAAIRSRIAVEEASKRPLKGLVLACSLALVLLSVLLLRTAPAPAPQAQADPDQELMLAVEQAIHSEGPEALAPAAILADEINSAKPQSQRNFKEDRNAN